MPGNDPGGFIVTILLGIVGAIIGGFIGKAIFGRGLETFWNLQTWVCAIIGSLILLKFTGRLRATRSVAVLTLLGWREQPLAGSRQFLCGMR